MCSYFPVLNKKWKNNMKQIANDDRQEVGTGWDGRHDTVGTTSPAVALHTVLSFENV